MIFIIISCLSPHQCVLSAAFLNSVNKVLYHDPCLLETSAQSWASGVTECKQCEVYVCWDIPFTKLLSCFTTVSISFCLSRSFFLN